MDPRCTGNTGVPVGHRAAVARAGWYGRAGQRRQRWLCRPVEGGAAPVVEVLPRIVASAAEHVCADCAVSWGRRRGRRRRGCMGSPRGYRACAGAWWPVARRDGATAARRAGRLRRRELDTVPRPDAEGSTDGRRRTPRRRAGVGCGRGVRAADLGGVYTGGVAGAAGAGLGRVAGYGKPGKAARRGRHSRCWPAMGYTPARTLLSGRDRGGPGPPRPPGKPNPAPACRCRPDPGRGTDAGRTRCRDPTPGRTGTGRPTTTWAVPDTGWSGAIRHSDGLADGTRVFVKAATDDDTERWLRTEHLSLQHVPERFAPTIIAWLDEPGRPILVTEDLSRAHWPASHQGVNWRPGDIDLLLTAVANLSQIEAPNVFLTHTANARSLARPTVRPGPNGLPRIAAVLGEVARQRRTAAHRRRIPLRRGRNEPGARGYSQRQYLHRRRPGGFRRLEPNLTRQRRPRSGRIAPDPAPGRRRPSLRRHARRRTLGRRRCRHARLSRSTTIPCRTGSSR